MAHSFMSRQIENDFKYYREWLNITEWPDENKNQRLDVLKEFFFKKKVQKNRDLWWKIPYLREGTRVGAFRD